MRLKRTSKKTLVACECLPATHGYCSDCDQVTNLAFKAADAWEDKVLSFKSFEGGTIFCQACGAAIAQLYRPKVTA